MRTSYAKWQSINGGVIFSGLTPNNRAVWKIDPEPVRGSQKKTDVKNDG